MAGEDRRFRFCFEDGGEDLFVKPELVEYFGGLKEREEELMKKEKTKAYEWRLPCNNELITRESVKIILDFAESHHMNAEYPSLAATVPPYKRGDKFKVQPKCPQWAKDIFNKINSGVLDSTSLCSHALNVKEFSIYCAVYCYTKDNAAKVKREMEASAKEMAEYKAKRVNEGNEYMPLPKIVYKNGPPYCSNSKCGHSTN